MRLQVILIAIILHALLAASQPPNPPKPHSFCWKNYYSRGSGALPSDCGDRDRIGSHCYEKCPAGYRRVSTDCHQSCPPGFIQEGTNCVLKEYNRGPGFKWKSGDGLTTKGRFARCESEHGEGNCELLQYVVYPKCKSGYTLSGCCICVPQNPKCSNLGLYGAIDDNSCIKKIISRQPQPPSCPPGTEHIEGLCHKTCRPNFYGIESICWAKTQKSRVSCGLGESADYKVCAESKLGVIASIGQEAISIAHLGNSIKTSNTPAKSYKLLRRKFELLKKAVQANKQQLTKLAKVASIAQQSNDSLTEEVQASIQSVDSIAELQSVDINKSSAIQLTRIATKLAALTSPSGIAAPWEKNVYAKCKLTN